ncbi:MAG: hypothetical protein WDA53_05365 [Bacillota bacterium]
MKMSKKKLWKVPLYCIFAGIITFYATVNFLGRFMITRLPDGTITLDNTNALIIHGGIFILVLIAGGLFFYRDMTRKEIFFSASIIVIIGLMMTLTQWAFNLTTGPGAVFFIYASLAFEWSNIVPQLLYRVNENLWLGAFIGNLTPYLFIIFGKK